MCLVVYLASRSPLPLVPWQQDSPAVHHHLSLPQVRYAGSHTHCGCGFNEGREYPEGCDEPETEQAAALDSAKRLVSYLLEYGVEEVYSCWSGDEGEARELERRISAEELAHPSFFFRERELLRIGDPAAPQETRASQDRTA